MQAYTGKQEGLYAGGCGQEGQLNRLSLDLDPGRGGALLLVRVSHCHVLALVQGWRSTGFLPRETLALHVGTC